MKAHALVQELRTRGIVLTLAANGVSASAPLTPRLRAAIGDAEGEIVELLRDGEALAARARAKGYDVATIDRAIGWLCVRRPGGEVRVTDERIEIELAGDVTGLFRKITEPAR